MMIYCVEVKYNNPGEKGKLRWQHFLLFTDDSDKQHTQLSRDGPYELPSFVHGQLVKSRHLQ